MCPLTCSVTTMSAGCCHTPGEGTRLGMRNKDRDGPTIANSSFAKCLLMGLAPALEKGWREGGGASLKVAALGARVKICFFTWGKQRREL